MLIAERLRRGYPVFGRHGLRTDYGFLSYDRTIEDARETAAVLGSEGDRDAIVGRFYDLTESETEDIAAMLELLIPQHTGTRVWFVEGIDLISEKVSDSKTVARELKKISRVAGKYGVAVIGTVGCPKEREVTGGYRDRNKIFGSAAWARKTATILILESYEDEGRENYRRVTMLPRAGKREKYFFHFTDDGFHETVEPKTQGANLPGETPAYAAITRNVLATFKADEPVTFRINLGSEATFGRWKQWAAQPSVGIIVKSGKRHYLTAAFLASVQGSTFFDSF